MPWLLPSALEDYSASQSAFPKTPYPYDPVREHSGSCSSSSSSSSSSPSPSSEPGAKVSPTPSSGIGSREESLESEPEALALSPKIVDQDTELEPTGGTKDLASPVEGLGILAGLDSPDHPQQGLLPSIEASDSVQLEHARAVHLTPCSGAQILVNLSRSEDAHGTCAAEQQLPRTPLRSRKRSAPQGINTPPLKRPRLTNLAPLRSIGPQTHIWVPSPVSPDRHFVEVLAERSSREGTLYKVVWRDSWVHESKLPNIEEIRFAHMLRYGKHWDILAGDLR